MKINFILTGLYKSGGMKVIFKYGEELKNSGHDVFFYRRLLPYNFMRGECPVTCPSSRRSRDESACRPSRTVRAPLPGRSQSPAPQRQDPTTGPAARPPEPR